MLFAGVGRYLLWGVPLAEAEGREMVEECEKRLQERGDWDIIKLSMNPFCREATLK